jgi:hypothetical protein
LTPGLIVGGLTQSTAGAAVDQKRVIRIGGGIRGR